MICGATVISDAPNAILRQYELFGIQLGLDTSLQLLELLGNPHLRVPMVHVAGSNGKGSVCAYLASALAVAGYRVGRYTSPHLVDWSERICINGQPIASQELVAVLHQVAAAIAKFPADAPTPTQFEVITAAMWLHFAQQNVDIAVIEVGLGGRLDATNVVPHPLVTVLVSISMEHWQRLGPTLGHIAREKAGIFKPGCPAIVGGLPEEAGAVVAARVQELDCPVCYPAAAVDLGAQRAESGGITYTTPIPGAAQRQNAALAIAALQQLQAQGWEKISPEAIAEGLSQTRWPGRLQWVQWRGAKILIDGAHNPDSARVLRDYVDSLRGENLRRENLGAENLGSENLGAKNLGAENLGAKNLGAENLGSENLRRFPVQWVMGMLSTKDHELVMQTLLRPGDRLYLVPVPGHANHAPLALATAALVQCPDLADCQTHDELFDGLLAAQSATVGDGLVVLCGSLYLVGQFLAHQPQSL
jgi:dihydrofolate synthase / folylpolyglutamate synthase